MIGICKGHVNLGDLPCMAGSPEDGSKPCGRFVNGSVSYGTEESTVGTEPGDDAFAFYVRISKPNGTCFVSGEVGMHEDCNGIAPAGFFVFTAAVEDDVRSESFAELICVMRVVGFGIGGEEGRNLGFGLSRERHSTMKYIGVRN